MVRFFRGRACRYLVVLLLSLTAFWLLLQQYASYKVQQQLEGVNQQYQRLAVQHSLPLLQLTAKNSRFIPWLDLLEIQQLELTLPNGVVLLQLSGLQLRGLLQLKPESFILTALPPTGSLLKGGSYQLSWSQLTLSPVLQLMLPTELQRQLQPMAGMLNWQQNNHQLHSQISLQMADQLWLQTAFELNILRADALGEWQQIQLQRINLALQQQLLPALQPWLARQGFASESMLF